MVLLAGIIIGWGGVSLIWGAWSIEGLLVGSAAGTLAAFWSWMRKHRAFAVGLVLGSVLTAAVFVMFEIGIAGFE